jgi:hypothetical protein
VLRAEQILALYVDEKLTYAEIAARAGVSPQRVHQVIDAALVEAVGRSRELAEFAFDRELHLIEAIIREAAEIILRKCDVCGGDEERRAHCKDCKRTGYAYPAQRRLLAMDRIGPAQSRRIKLTGLDKSPQPTSHPADAYYEMLQKLSDEEFEAERARFEAGLAARPTHA